ncbi:MAG: RNA-directed DNA polymerase [Myxococcales bacterium]|nr:RNA-directed DNA polymerase [Myxococcales bacterium]
MNLVNLLVTLRDALVDFEANRQKILTLLKTHQGLSEFEVARYFVAAEAAPRVHKYLASRDPRERRIGVECARFLLPPNDAAAVLRRALVDPDTSTRDRADRLLAQLERQEAPLRARRSTPEAELVDAWGPTGWRFGRLLRNPPARKKAKLAPVPRAVSAVLKSEETFLKAIEVDSVSALQPLYRAGDGPGAPYVRFEIAKRGGGVRAILAPRKALKGVQRALYEKVLSKLATHDAAHGFVPGRSVVTNARPHQGAVTILKVDLADYFPTLHYRRVQGYFARVLKANAKVATLIAGLTTHRDRLADGYVTRPGVMPQGAPTSPALANLVSRRLDERLDGLAKKVGLRYTRYADDLTFSWHEAPPTRQALARVLWWVSQIAREEGFALNERKTRVLRPHQQQLVTGVVVNAGLHVPRALKRTLRAMLHEARVKGVEVAARGRADFYNTLLGHAAWVNAVEPALGARLLAEVKALAAREGAAHV